MKKSPKSVVKELYETESMQNSDQIAAQVKYIMSQPEQVQFIMQFMSELADYKDRKEGVDIEMAFYAQLPTHLPLEKITAPSLIIHGTHDADVLFYHGVYAAQSIAHAEYHWIYLASHLGSFLSTEEEAAQEKAHEFIRRLG